MPKQKIVVNGKVDKNALIDFYQESMDIALGVQEHDIHPSERLFSASSTICTKETLLKAIAPEFIQPADNETKRKWAIGHWWHALADKGADAALWKYRGDIIRITPFELSAFPLKVTLPTGANATLTVDGTPDHILFFPEEKFLLLADQKSANDFGFGKVNKEGTQEYHAIQVGTYFDGLKRSPLGPIVEKSSVWMCHLSKSHGGVRMTHADPLMLQNANVFWNEVFMSYMRFMETDNIPGEVKPIASWACRYCSVFKNWDDCSNCTTLEELEELNGD